MGLLGSEEKTSWAGAQPNRTEHIYMPSSRSVFPLSHLRKITPAHLRPPESHLRPPDHRTGLFPRNTPVVLLIPAGQERSEESSWAGEGTRNARSFWPQAKNQRNGEKAPPP